MGTRSVLAVFCLVVCSAHALSSSVELKTASDVFDSRVSSIYNSFAFYVLGCRQSSAFFETPAQVRWSLQLADSYNYPAQA